MKFTFTKEVPKKYHIHGHGYLRKCKIYKIYSGENLIGQFFYHHNLCFFSFGDQSYRIDIERHFFKRSKYDLIDEKTQAKIGEYKFSGVAMYVGLLTINGQNIFVCNKVKPNVRYSMFDSKTWGHYKMQVTNKINAVEYNFRVRASFFGTPAVASYPFTGELELWGDNLLLAFAGFFLIEWNFESEDSG